MDDRELMDKIRKSMEDTPVPESLKPENIQKMLEEQSENQQPNEAARTEKDDQPKDTTTHRFWNARTSRYIGAAAAAVVVIAALGITPGLLKTHTEAKPGDTTYTASNDTQTLESTEETTRNGAQTASETTNETALAQADIQSAEESDKAAPETTEPVKVAQATDPVSGIAHMDSYDDLYNMLKEWNENPTTSNDARVMTIEESADTGSANTVAASDMASSDAASPDSVIATYPEGETDSDFSYDEKSDPGDYSSTNTQEETVDEADIVKTDGTCIYAMDSKGTVRIVDAASMKLVGAINGENSADYKEMYVEGSCLQLIRQQVEYVTYKGELKLPSTSDEDSDNDSTQSVRSSYSMPVTTVSVLTYDISDRTAPKLTGTYQQDGSYLSSRRSNGYLYLFTSYAPDAGNNADQLEYYVPRSGQEYIAYDHIYLPEQEGSDDFSYNGKAYLVSGAVAVGTPDQASDIMAVVSGAEIFYVSENNIYSAVSTWNEKETRTELVRIGYADGKFTDGSTGSVAGELNDNFSLDEYADHLRVVTTVESWSSDYSDFSRSNSLYVLDSSMKTVGKIENLAEGEEIKSARFMGETGYFVTYKNTDPLFSVDLSDPENPKVLGELKITGFSSYLHFYGENKLLGIGWETDPDTGNTIGMKCSMFDISDPSDVKETDRFVLKDVSFCDALTNYRSILAAPKKGLFGFAYGMYGSNSDIYDSSENFYYSVFSFDEEDGFVPNAYVKMNDCGLFDDRMEWQDYRTARGIYIKDTFYLVTEKGIASYNMADDYSVAGILKWNE